MSVNFLKKDPKRQFRVFSACQKNSIFDTLRDSQKECRIRQLDPTLYVILQAVELADSRKFHSKLGISRVFTFKKSNQKDK